MKKRVLVVGVAAMFAQTDRSTLEITKNEPIATAGSAISKVKRLEISSESNFDVLLRNKQIGEKGFVTKCS